MSYNSTVAGQKCRSMVVARCRVGATALARDFLIGWTTARDTRQ